MSTNETATQSLKGHLLVASPYADGTPYRRAAVFLLEHSDQGAAGIVVDGAFRASINQLRAGGLGPPSSRLGQQAPDHAVLRGVPVRVATWEPGQLELEVQSGLWLHTPANPGLVFSSRVPRWSELVQHVGRTVYRDALGIEDFPANLAAN